MDLVGCVDAEECAGSEGEFGIAFVEAAVAEHGGGLVGNDCANGNGRAED